MSRGQQPRIGVGRGEAECRVGSGRYIHGRASDICCGNFDVEAAIDVTVTVGQRNDTVRREGYWFGLPCSCDLSELIDGICNHPGGWPCLPRRRQASG
jgi:hypothetical protein